MRATRPQVRLARALLLSLLAGLGPTASAEPLGRLFSTPAERAALDASRANGGAPAAAEQAPPTIIDEEAPSVTMNGVVRRSSGKSTVWINQVPQQDGSNHFRATPGAAALTLRANSGKPVTLKAGQSFDPDNGKVREDDGR